ncbi:hypothetical protein GW916_02635 [bacterium]|nr:hypothetical protein [bacterium]
MFLVILSFVWGNQSHAGENNIYLENGLGVFESKGGELDKGEQKRLAECLSLVERPAVNGKVSVFLLTAPTWCQPCRDFESAGENGIGLLGPGLKGQKGIPRSKANVNALDMSSGKANACVEAIVKKTKGVLFFPMIVAYNKDTESWEYAEARKAKTFLEEQNLFGVETLDKEGAGGLDEQH